LALANGPLSAKGGGNLKRVKHLGEKKMTKGGGKQNMEDLGEWGKVSSKDIQPDE